MTQTIERLINYALAYEAAADAYKGIAMDAAKAEAAHKAARAKAILTYKVRADRRVSHAEAETAAEADDEVSDLYLERLTSAAVADSARQKLFQLREMVGVARTVAAGERAADGFHASGYTGAA